MVQIAAHVGVEQPHAEARIVLPSKERREVFPDLPRRIADAEYRGPFRFVRKNRLAAHLPPETQASRGECQPRLPAIQWVMVSVADERANASGVQPVKAVHEA